MEAEDLMEEGMDPGVGPLEHRRHRGGGVICEENRSRVAFEKAVRGESGVEEVGVEGEDDEMRVVGGVGFVEDSDVGTGRVVEESRGGS